MDGWTSTHLPLRLSVLIQELHRNLLVLFKRRNTERSRRPSVRQTKSLSISTSFLSNKNVR
jgi:hypothetical protein